MIELCYPWRPTARPSELSRLRIRVYGEKVFEIRWDEDGRFKVVHYEPGDWKRTLRTPDGPELNPEPRVRRDHQKARNSESDHHTKLRSFVIGH